MIIKPSIKVTQKNRDSNIELLRIILMLMIIAHHVIVHGLGLNYEPSQLQNDSTIYYKFYVNCFVVLGVNSFVFISGFYGMNLKIKTLISFVLQAVFYSVVLHLLFIYVNHTPFHLTSFVTAFIPISTYKWWFLSIYLGLYIISPILNKGFDLLSYKYKLLIILSLLYFDCFSSFKWHSLLADDGYSIYHFITLYILARYLGQNICKVRIPFVKLALSTSILMLIGFYMLSTGRTSKIWMLFSYNNPLLMLSSIFLFYLFKKIKIQNKFINIISGLVFGIYLLHEYSLVKVPLYKFVSQIENNYSGFVFIIYIIGVVLSIFVVGAIVEFLRKSFFDSLLSKIEIFWENNRWIQNMQQSLFEKFQIYFLNKT